MQTGWIFVGNWYYLEETGAMHTGWLLDNGSWYYLDPSNGAMLTGGHWINGTYYWFNQSGAWVN
jgi:glucan-binding YG repeat protein